jgi:hypothetical protein
MPSKAAVIGRLIPLIVLEMCGAYLGSRLSSAISYSMVAPFIQGSISPSTTLRVIGIPLLIIGLPLFIIGMRRLARSYFNWVTAGVFFISATLLILGLNMLSDAAIWSSMMPS